MPDFEILLLVLLGILGLMMEIPPFSGSFCKPTSRIDYRLDKAFDGERIIHLRVQFRSFWGFGPFCGSIIQSYALSVDCKWLYFESRLPVGADISEILNDIIEEVFWDQQEDLCGQSKTSCGDTDGGNSATPPPPGNP